METEIEIKFFFNSEFALELDEKVNFHHVISSKRQLLHNVYFDTDKRSLRKMGMGLRIRSFDQKSEQTIKTAGRVIGGLHQRPEYNEPIEGLHPELAKFQRKIWPADCDIKQLENELLPIFSTDFNRQTWVIEMPEETLIEVAYDSGFIETDLGKEEICEVELELLKGDENQLFVLGEKIVELPQVRLGNISKAQRGYMLAEGIDFKAKALAPSPLIKSMSVEQALLINLQHGLQHTQYHEHCYLDSFDDAALYQLLQGIKFLHQNLKLFKNVVPQILNADWVGELHWLARSFSCFDERFILQNMLEDKGFYIRKLPDFKSLIKKLEKQYNEQPDRQAIKDILTSTRYCQFVLKFTKWLIQFEKEPFFSQKTSSIESFATDSLEAGWRELKLASHHQQFSIVQLLSYQGLLESNLLLGLCLGNLFPAQKSNTFHSSWLDIKQGIKELAMVNIVAEYAEFETDKRLQAEYLKWVTRKQNSLLHALQQSKQQAMLKKSYWQNGTN
ncbi:adenylate cyclase [Psychromonas ingrahamii 37]|uniref:Adenylate cyclase n=1 Tax=Psychromonas ingrahamii (strain DSM 17664 / CCUG 51855 / 37) TaxID=357804 RepID=A1SRD5_PSYIN|nr:CYTH and CHAD domain-containing protein [Psychromonas ingrahamii]ABM02050.1 adenylate cyclase [Psychromonas ingrahamii 37]